MAEHLYRTWCEVSLDAISHNLEQFQSIAPGARVMGVVKADAYGHGALEIARTLSDCGVSALAVAFADEAIQLRNSGIDTSILVLGHTPVENMGVFLDLDITPTVYHFSAAKAVSNIAQRKGKTAKLHVKLDTGMNRLGYPAGPEAARDILDLARLPGIEIEGIYTHLSCADEEDATYTLRQFELFSDTVRLLEKDGLQIPIRHVCNSAAAMRFPEMHLDMIRIGISLYGVYPSQRPYPLELRPAMALKTTVAQLKEIPAGERVSYGGVYTTDRRTRLATIPVGYADGYSRLLSGRARVLVNGRFTKVLGRICMDQCMIDVTDVNTINIEDEVVLFGRQGEQRIPIEELADIVGTIPYETLCVIGRRIPRCYTYDGRVVEILNYLL